VYEFAAEFIGTMILVLLGDGVVANVCLKGTKGHAGGWIVITAGWGFAVFTAVMITSEFSGAHINPAVTIGLAAAGKFAAAKVPLFLARPVPRRRGGRVAGLAVLQGPLRRQSTTRARSSAPSPPGRRSATRSAMSCAR
jgi:hypothetical protein